MKSGIYCIYQGEEYESNRDQEGNRYIFTNDLTKIDGSFYDKYHNGYYRKIIDISEVEEFYEITPYVMVDGHRFDVLREVGDKYEIATGDYELAEKMHLQVEDRHFCTGWIPKEDAEYFEIRKPWQPPSEEEEE